MAKKQKKQKLPKIKRVDKTTMPVKFVFSDTDKLNLSQTLTGHMTTRDSLEDQMKTVSSEYKAKIKVVDGQIDEVRNKLVSGYEMRDTNVLIHFNKPRKGLKRIIHAGTKEVIRDETMSPADLHAELFEKNQVASRKAAEESKPAATGKNNPVDPGWSAAAKTPEKPLNSPEIPDEEGGKKSTAATA